MKTERFKTSPNNTHPQDYFCFAYGPLSQSVVIAQTPLNNIVYISVNIHSLINMNMASSSPKVEEL